MKFSRVISFIIPLFNHLEQSKAMLASLLETVPSHLEYEIILIDDASTDGTQAWLLTLTLKNLRILINESNQGYAKSNNKAISLAKGEVLVLLNNDLLLQPGWLEPMLALLYNSALPVGIVGNIQRRVADDSIDHAGVQINHLAKFFHLQDNVDERRLLWQQTLAVTGACCLLFREHFSAVGGFDERFHNGGEDYDLCLKLRALGKFAYVANTSCVKHHVSLTRDRASINNERNSQLLFAKWRSVIVQEVKNAWVQLLTGNLNYGPANELHLQASAYHTPHITSWLLANSQVLTEEIRWQSLLNHQTPDYMASIERYEGFHRDNQHAFAYIQTRAWFSIAKGCAASNIFISGKVLEPAFLGCQGLKAIEVIVEVNGMQLQRWQDLSFGYFNWIFENPVLSVNYPSVVSITLAYKSNLAPDFQAIPDDLSKTIRFSHILLDDQIVLDLQRLDFGAQKILE